MTVLGRVFLSHTSELRQYPAHRSYVDAAERAVKRVQDTPLDMSYFTAEARPSADACREAVAAADVYVGIIGFRYGTPMKDDPSRSYTQMEFAAATEAGIPRLVFILDENTEGPSALFRDLEFGNRQEQFRRELLDSDVTVRMVSDPSDLETALYQSLVTLDNHAATGTRGGLPAEASHFTGRDGPLNELMVQIARDRPRGTVVSIYAIDGMAGVGKTAFARHAAQVLAGNYRDGSIWIDLYGHTPGLEPRDPAEVLEQLMIRLGTPPDRIEKGIVARREQWRRLAHRRKLLIVLDNAYSSNQVQPLMPEAPECLVLVTSRRKLSGLTDAYPLYLDVLGWEEAETLFTRLVGEDRCADRRAVRAVLEACGRLPLAIRLIAARLRHHPGEMVADVAADLAERSGALDALEAEDLSVRVAFDWSYRSLTEAQQRAFRLLGWHPGPELSQQVVAAVADLNPATARRISRELADHNLLEEVVMSGVPGAPRYRMHDLVRLYAREKAVSEEPTGEEAALLQRLTTSYLAALRLADSLLSAGGEDARRPESPVNLVDKQQARAWISVDRRSIVACADAAPVGREVAIMASIAAQHLRALGYWSDVRRLHTRNIEIYDGLGDAAGQMSSLWRLGDVERLLGEYTKASEHHERALAMAEAVGDRIAMTAILCERGDVERLVGEYEKARVTYTDALALARELGDGRRTAASLWGLGHVSWLLGEFDQARETYGRALEESRAALDTRVEVLSLFGLGEVERMTGHYPEARDHHAEGFRMARDTGDRGGQIDTLWGLAEVERAVGECADSRIHHNETLLLTRELSERASESLTLWALAELEVMGGKLFEARDYQVQALEIARAIGFPRAETDALCGLAKIEWSTAQLENARLHQTQGLELARKLGARTTEVAAENGMAQLEVIGGDLAKAGELYANALSVAREIGYWRGEAEALLGLAETRRLAGDSAVARDHYGECLESARRRGDTPCEAKALTGLGDAAAQDGEACEHWQAAANLYRRMTLPIPASLKASLRTCQDRSA